MKEKIMAIQLKYATELSIVSGMKLKDCESFTDAILNDFLNIFSDLLK